MGSFFFSALQLAVLAVHRAWQGIYTHRYKKEHSTIKLLKDILKHPPVNLKDNGWVEPPPAMSHYPQCIVPGDSIQSYKNYYIEAKAYFAKWTSRPTPVWFSEGVQ